MKLRKKGNYMGYETFWRRIYDNVSLLVLDKMSSSILGKTNDQIKNGFSELVEDRVWDGICERILDKTDTDTTIMEEIECAF